MSISALQTSLKTLRRAIADTESILEEMRTERDPLAYHIFVARRQYRNLNDYSKSGRHKAQEADSSYRTACELGYKGNLQTWYDLLVAKPKD